MALSIVASSILRAVLRIRFRRRSSGLEEFSDFAENAGGETAVRSLQFRRHLLAEGPVFLSLNRKDVNVIGMRQRQAQGAAHFQRRGEVGIMDVRQMRRFPQRVRSEVVPVAGYALGSKDRIEDYDALVAGEDIQEVETADGTILKDIQLAEAFQFPFEIARQPHPYGVVTENRIAHAQKQGLHRLNWRYSSPPL